MPSAILLDTDTGVDDALAIILALRSPELHVVAITTVAGNVTVDRCTENALRIVEACGHSVPVHRGESSPLHVPLFTADDMHGNDGLGGMTLLHDPDGAPRYSPPSIRAEDEPAPTAIARSCREADDLTVIAVGPLTNVAKAMLDYPNDLRRVREIVIMGGAFHARGNTTPTAEFNLYVDPHAADIVFTSGAKLTIVPLDVTEQCILREEDLRRARELLRDRSDYESRESLQRLEMIEDVTRFSIERHKRRRGFGGMYLHDPLAVAVAIDRSLVTCEAGTVQIVTSGDERGTTRMQAAAATQGSSVAIGVDSKRFETLFRRRVLCET